MNDASVTPTTDDPDAWRRHAACIGRMSTFARTMAPTTSKHKSLWQRKVEREAFAICNTCPVRVQCLDAELATMREGVRSYGVFGGTTADERRRIVGRVAPKPSIVHGTRAGYMAHKAHPDIHGEPCADCRDACREYTAHYRATLNERSSS